MFEIIADVYEFLVEMDDGITDILELEDVDIAELDAEPAADAERPPPEKLPDEPTPGSIDWALIWLWIITVGLLGSGLYFGIQSLDKHPDIPPSI